MATDILRIRIPRLLRGPCPACGSRHEAPLCQECRRASRISDRPAVSFLASRPLYVLGAYHGTTARHTPSPLGRTLCAFKDRGDRYAGRCLARLFAAGLHEILPPPVERLRIVPVPSDPARLRIRGVSPAVWLAQALSRRAGARCCLTTLQRLPGRPAQRSLDGAARRRNAPGAFVRGRSEVRGYRIVLVDDVITTGATLAEAALCLGDAGVEDVRFAVLACADEERIRHEHR